MTFSTSSISLTAIGRFSSKLPSGVLLFFPCVIFVLLLVVALGTSSLVAAQQNCWSDVDAQGVQTWEWAWSVNSLSNARSLCDAVRAPLSSQWTKGSRYRAWIGLTFDGNNRSALPVFDQGNIAPANWESLVDNATRDWYTNSACFTTDTTEAKQTPCDNFNTSYRVYCERIANASTNHERWGMYPDPQVGRPIVAYTIIALERTRAGAAAYCAAMGGELAVFANASHAMQAITSVLNYSLGTSWERFQNSRTECPATADRGIWTGLTSDATSFFYENSAQYGAFLGGSGQLPVNGASAASGACWSTRLDPNNGDVHATLAGCSTTRHFMCSRAVVRAIATLGKSTLEQNQTTNATVVLSSAPMFGPLTLYFYTSNAGAVVSHVKSCTFYPGATDLKCVFVVFASGTGGADTKVAINYDMESRQWYGWKDVAWNSSSTIATTEAEIVGTGGKDVSLNVSFAIRVNATPSVVTLINDQRINVTLTLSQAAAVNFQMAVVDVPDCLLAAPGVMFYAGQMEANVTLIASTSTTCPYQNIQWSPIYIAPWSPSVLPAVVNVSVIAKISVKFLIVGQLSIYDAGISTAGNATIRLNQVLPSALPINVYSTNCTWFLQSSPASFTISNANPEANVTIYSRRLQTRVMYCQLSLEIDKNISFAVVDPLVVQIRQQAEIIPIYIPNIFIVEPEILYWRIQTYWGSENVTVIVDPLLSPYAKVITPYAVMTPTAYSRVTETINCTLPPYTIESRGGLNVSGPDAAMIAPFERQRMLPQKYVTVLRSQSGDKYAIQLWASTYRLDPRGYVRINTSLSIAWYNGNYPNNNKITVKAYDGCTFSDGTTSKTWKKSDLNVGELLIWVEADFKRVTGSTLNCTIVASRANSASDIVVYDNTLTFQYQPYDPQIGWTGTLNQTLPTVIPINTPYMVWVQVDRWPSGPNLQVNFTITAVDPCIQIISTSTTFMTMFEWNPIEVIVNGTCVPGSCQRVRATAVAPVAQWPNYDVGFDGISAEWCVMFNRYISLFITEVNAPSFLYAFSGKIQLRYTVQGLVGSDTITIFPNASDATFSPVGVLWEPASYTFSASVTSFVFNATMINVVPPTIWFGFSNTDPGSNYDKTIRSSNFPSKIIFGSYISFTPAITTMYKGKSVVVRLAASGVTLPGPVLLQVTPTPGLTCVTSVILTNEQPSAYITVTSDGTKTGELAVSASVQNYTAIFSGLFVSCNIFVHDDSVLYMQYGYNDTVRAPRYLWVDQKYPLDVSIQPRTLSDNLNVTMRQQYETPFYLEDQLSFQRVFTSVGGAPLRLEFKGLYLPVQITHRYEMIPLAATQSTYEPGSRTSPIIHNRPKMVPALIGPRSFFSGIASDVGAGATFYFVVGPPYTGAVRFTLVLTDLDSGEALDPQTIFANSSWIIQSDYSGAPIQVPAYSWFARNLSLRIVPDVTTYHVNSTFTDARVFKRPSGTYTLTDTPSPSFSRTVSETLTPPPTPSRSISKTISISEAITASVTQSISGTFSHSADPTESKSQSTTLTPTRTASVTLSSSPTQTFSPSITVSKSTSISKSPTASDTLTLTRSRSPSITRTLSISKSDSPTVALTESLTSTLTRSKSASITKSPTPDLSQSLSQSETITATTTPSKSPSRTVTLTRSLSPTDSASPSPTPDRSASGSISVTDSVTLTRSPTKSNSLTVSLSSTLSESRSISLTSSDPITRTKTPTVSKSISSVVSDSFTETASETLTPPPTPSNSITETASRTRSRPSLSLSETFSERITPTKTFTRFSPTKPPTPSRSATWTGETPTATFHTWITCGEGWILFNDDFCYKHWPIKTHLSNESLPTPMTFDDAQRWCEGFRAHIPPIQHVAQMKFIQDLVGKNSGRRFWNGVYQDKRYRGPQQVWRTVYNRTHFNDFFVWDGRRKMPQYEDCVAVHNFGDLSVRVVGGNGAMITYPCDSRAEVVCARRREPWGVTAVNQTTSGRILVVEGQPLVLSVVGSRIPRGMQVQLQTTSYTTHSGPEGEPTQCSQTKPRNPVLLNVSVPAVATNVTPSYRFMPLCNGTCAHTNVHFPASLKLVRGHKYSICFFLPYHFPTPLSSDEYMWNFLPNVWVEIAESRANYLRETCERHKNLINLLYYNPNATDVVRNVPSPFYFDGPIEPKNWQGVEGYRP